MKEHILPGTVIEDISDEVAQVALQGPKAHDVIRELLSEEDIPQKYYTAIEHVDIEGMDCLISFTGYTGENGYEIYTANANIVKLWRLLLEKGEKYGLIPCGLGARDTLRLEAAMPLYGHELSETISPVEAALDFAIKLDKEEFLGKEALLKIKERGEEMLTRVGLEIVDKGVLREHQDIYLNEECIGHTTSGTYSPLLQTSIAMALVPVKYSALDTIVEVDVRGRRLKAKVIELPFYKKK